MNTKKALLSHKTDSCTIEPSVADPHLLLCGPGSKKCPYGSGYGSYRG